MQDGIGGSQWFCVGRRKMAAWCVSNRADPLNPAALVMKD